MDWMRFNELLALSEAGKTEETINGLRALLRSSEPHEDRGTILLAIGAHQRKLGCIDDARRTFAQIATSDESSTDTKARGQFLDACLSADQGQWMDTLEKLERLQATFHATLDDPANEDLLQDVRRVRAVALYELGRKAEARTLFEKAVQVEYERATSLYYLGRCYYDLGDLPRAKGALREALKLDLYPVYQPSAHYILGLAYHWTGQSAWAIPEFQWCLKNDNRGLVGTSKVLGALVNASRALGLERDAEGYARMLKSARH